MKILACAICALILITGCGSKETHEQQKPHTDHNGEEGQGATYVEGKGISLHEQTRTSIGLELLEVSEKSIISVTLITAQVYRSATEPTRKYSGEKTGIAYATGLVSEQIAAQLHEGQEFIFHTGRSGTVWKINRNQSDILGKVEVLLSLPDPEGTLAIGTFVEAKISSGGNHQEVISIPQSALLETATGTFVFAQNGEALLRTAVETGQSNGTQIEIISGLYEGDVIAKPVETLYMIELRATKGGGHCH